MPPWRRPVLQSGAAAAALGVRDAALYATTVRAVGLRNEPWQGLTVTYVFHIHHYASLEVLTSTNTYARIQGRAVKKNKTCSRSNMYVYARAQIRVRVSEPVSA